MDYHNLFLNNIKINVGASYIAYEKYKDKYQLRVLIPNFEPIVYDLDGTPNDVTPQRYDELLKSILDAKEVQRALPVHEGE